MNKFDCVYDLFHNNMIVEQTTETLIKVEITPVIQDGSTIQAFKQMLNLNQHIYSNLSETNNEEDLHTFSFTVPLIDAKNTLFHVYRMIRAFSAASEDVEQVMLRSEDVEETNELLNDLINRENIKVDQKEKQIEAFSFNKDDEEIIDTYNDTFDPKLAEQGDKAQIELQQKFQAVMDKYNKDPKVQSFLNSLIEHPTYKAELKIDGSVTTISQLKQIITNITYVSYLLHPQIVDTTTNQYWPTQALAEWLEKSYSDSVMNPSAENFPSLSTVPGSQAYAVGGLPEYSTTAPSEAPTIDRESPTKQSSQIAGSEEGESRFGECFNRILQTLSPAILEKLDDEIEDEEDVVDDTRPFGGKIKKIKDDEEDDIEVTADTEDEVRKAKQEADKKLLAQTKKEYDITNKPPSKVADLYKRKITDTATSVTTKQDVSTLKGMNAVIRAFRTPITESEIQDVKKAAQEHYFKYLRVIRKSYAKKELKATAVAMIQFFNDGGDFKCTLDKNQMSKLIGTNDFSDKNFANVMLNYDLKFTNSSHPNIIPNDSYQIVDMEKQNNTFNVYIQGTGKQGGAQGTISLVDKQQQAAPQPKTAPTVTQQDQSIAQPTIQNRRGRRDLSAFACYSLTEQTFEEIINNPVEMNKIFDQIFQYIAVTGEPSIEHELDADEASKGFDILFYKLTEDVKKQII